MRLWQCLPMSVQSKLKLTCTCFILTPATKYFGLLVLAHCIIQIALQATAFSHDQAAATSLDAIMQQAGVPFLLAVLSDSDGHLQLCKGEPGNCSVIVGNNLTVAAEKDTFNTSSLSSSVAPSRLAVPSVRISNNVSATSSINALNSTGSSATIRPTATAAPVFPNSALDSVDTDQMGGNRNWKPRSLASRNMNTNERTRASERRSLYPSRKYSKRSVSVQPQLNSTGALENVTISGLTGVPGGTIVDAECVEALSWPIQIFRDARREDATMIAFEIWLLIISALAIMKESIPHLVASITSIMLSTAWSIYMVIRDLQFKSDFQQVITNKACGGVNLLPDFWGVRWGLDIATLASNGVVLPIALFLTIKLFETYNQRTFKRVGASSQINRMYKLVLCFAVIVQLSVFFTIGSAALWIDELITGVVGQFTSNRVVYEAIFIATNILEVPWLIISWKAIHTEHNILTMLFLIIGSLIAAAWAAMFASSTYRWTFSTWPFFACMTVLSFVLLVASLVLGAICRSNFGKGLAHYLEVQKALANSDFPPVFFSNNPDQDANKTSASTPGSAIIDEEKYNQSEDERNARFTVLLPKYTMKTSLSDDKTYASKFGDVSESGEDTSSVRNTAILAPGPSFSRFSGLRVASDSWRLSGRSTIRQSRVSSTGMLSRITTSSSLRTNQTRLPTIAPSPQSEDLSPPAYSPSILDAYSRPDSMASSYSHHSPVNSAKRLYTGSALSPLSAGAYSARISSLPRSRLSTSIEEDDAVL